MNALFISMAGAASIVELPPFAPPTWRVPTMTLAAAYAMGAEPSRVDPLSRMCYREFRRVSPSRELVALYVECKT